MQWTCARYITTPQNLTKLSAFFDFRGFPWCTNINSAVHGSGLGSRRLEDAMKAVRYDYNV